MKAVVAERGQVTIPLPLRRRLGIRPRTVLEFSEEGGKLQAVKVPERDAVARVYGRLGWRRRTDDVLRELRGSP